MKYQQITVAVKGNKFGNQYARDGINGDYYSLWKLKLKIDDNYDSLKDYDAILVGCNYDKSDIKQKFFNNMEIFNNLRR